MKLTDKQISAARHKNGPCLVLAVPGAGKTTMILERIKYLAKDIDPKHILSLTFSKTQAIDMKLRYDGSKSNFMTIHAFCYLIIRNYYKKNKKTLRLLESDYSYNKYNLVRQIYLDINDRVISNEDLKNFFTEIGYMRNAMLGPSYLKKIEIKNVEKIYKAYERFKKENGYIDFDDMQTIAYDLINKDEKLLRSIKNKYKYIQLDEGQDTSLLQFRILERIAYPENNIMIVADDDQSIYSFRAANPSYLLNFDKTYPDGKIIRMDENHRSQKNIVNLSSKFIDQNTNRYKKNLYTNISPSSKVSYKSLKTSRDLYSYIIKNIEDNKTNAILYRNNISSLNLISFLMEDDIDFDINLDNLDFLESKIVIDIMNIIRFGEDFNDVDIFTEIYYKIKTYLKKEDIDKLELKPINMNIFDYLYEIVDEDMAYNLSKKEREFKHLNSLSLDRKISYIYSYMGYGEYIKMFSSKYYEEVMNKDLYIESLVNFSKDLFTIDDFYEKVSDLEKIINKRSKSNIILSTIHKSKGLEYDNVFVIDLVKNEFPMINDYRNKEDEIEEERRIMYVAMTRARSNLHLLTLKTRNNKKTKPSEFYIDLYRLR